MHKTLVIVPAKGESIRLPRKNMLPLNGKPIFLHSCDYARLEGFENVVVSSDSDEILNIASKHGYLTHKELVNESRLENCINQVLGAFSGYDAFIVLQPTSPLRKHGYLSRCMEQTGDCVISAQKIKPIAFFNGKAMFDTNRRVLAQDCTDWIWHFDGSVIIRNTQDYLNNGILITTDCQTIENKFPYYLQVDSREEYELINKFYNN